MSLNRTLKPQGLSDGEDRGTNSVSMGPNSMGPNPLIPLWSMTRLQNFGENSNGKYESQHTLSSVLILYTSKTSNFFTFVKDDVIKLLF